MTLDYTKKNVPLSLKSQCATRWESWIHYISPLPYHLADLLLALNVLDSYWVEKKDGETACNVRTLILRIESWSFILSIAICLLSF